MMDMDGHELEQAPGVGDGQGSLAFAVHGAAKSQTWLSDWTELEATTATVKIFQARNHLWVND